MKAKDITIWMCRFLAIYCLLCAIGISQAYFQSLAVIFNMNFVFGTLGTAKTSSSLSGVSWPQLMIAAVPIALYLITAAVLWYRATDITEKIIEPFSNKSSEFVLTPAISGSFVVGLVGLYVVLNCVPQFVYFVFSFVETYQTNIKGRVLSSTGQILCNILQIIAGGILIWRSKEIAQRLSPSD